MQDSVCFCVYTLKTSTFKSTFKTGYVALILSHFHSHFVVAKDHFLPNV